jgi:hypothetical protein
VKDDKLREVLAEMYRQGMPVFTQDNPLGRLLTQGLAKQPIFLVASDGVVTKEDIVVCQLCDDAHPLIFLDNEIGDCVRCRRRLQFRPDCPRGAMHCAECALAMLRL